MAGAIARAMPRDYREKTIGPSAIKRLEDRPDQRASSDSLDQLATVFELDIDWLRMVNQERIQQPGSVNLRSLIDKALELDDEGRETAESFLEGLRRKHGAAERDPVKRRRQHE